MASHAINDKFDSRQSTKLDFPRLKDSENWNTP